MLITVLKCGGEDLIKFTHINNLFKGRGISYI